MFKLTKLPRFAVLNLLLFVAVAATFGVFSAGTQQVSAKPSLTFTGSNAASYADRYATSRNSNFPSFGSDCTNFTSQAINAGGYPMQYSDPQWWIQHEWWGWNYTHSWSVVVDNWNFLIQDYPGGWDWGYQDTSRNTNGALYGDILFYDWDGNGTLDHTSMEVAYSGCDPSNPSWCGDLVDQHTNDRYHAIWHLKPYNSQAATTKVKLMHIDPNN